MEASSRISSLILLLAMGCVGCGTYRPRPLAESSLIEWAIVKQKGPLTVKVVVVSPKESRELFGFDLARHGVQPVWIEVTNASDHDYMLIPRTMDPEYFSPFEVAWMGRLTYVGKGRRDMERYFYEQSIPLMMPAGEVTSGYIFCNIDMGVRHALVTLIGRPGELVSIPFMVPVPGMVADYQLVDFESIYERFDDLDDQGLLRWIEQQPAFVTDKSGKNTHEPVNIAIVGDDDAVWAAFGRTGWDVTEPTTQQTIDKTIAAALSGTDYRYMPISPLYLYGRQQDIGLQKGREKVDKRNHLRLWLAPVTYRGRRVWIGQISRDIGTRWTFKVDTPVRHVIDPDVDETRNYLIQDLLSGQGLARLEFVGGGEPASIDQPKQTYAGDKFFTDGFRAVLFMSDDPVPYDEVDINWGRVVRRKGSEKVRNAAAKTPVGKE